MVSIHVKASGPQQSRCTKHTFKRTHTHPGIAQTNTGGFAFVPPCSEKSLFTWKLNEIRLSFFCTNWKAAVLLQIKDILLLTALEQLVSVALLSCNCTHKGWLWRQNTALETVVCPQWNRHLKFWPLLVLQRLPEHNKTGKCPVQSHCPAALSAVFGYYSVQTLKSASDKFQTCWH